MRIKVVRRVTFLCVGVMLLGGCEPSAGPPVISSTDGSVTAGGNPERKAFHAEAVDPLTVGHWISPDKRQPVLALDARTESHSGRQKTIRQWIDRPTLLMFFFTRCENPFKCSKTVTLAGEMQQRLKEEQAEMPLRILLVTYDPDVDDRDRLAQFAAARGVDLSAGSVVCLRTLDGSLEVLCDELNVPVGFALGNVAVHDVVGYLFDDRGAVARIYRAALPDLDQVLADSERVRRED